MMTGGPAWATGPSWAWAAAVAPITAVTGTAPILLTGDNGRAARRLAAQVGIRDVRWAAAAGQGRRRHPAGSRGNTSPCRSRR